MNDFFAAIEWMMAHETSSGASASPGSAMAAAWSNAAVLTRLGGAVPFYGMQPKPRMWQIKCPLCCISRAGYPGERRRRYEEPVEGGAVRAFIYEGVSHNRLFAAL